ncbi:MAG: NfeD family protein [Spirochaetia bacterium]|nr:NfeD family protein [Spirochaetia bacterium]MDD7698231.1 NfeD family protein [Spirochaetia bacterium]MDY4211939.1 NfeD family protein [Treponema sp.]
MVDFIPNVMPWIWTGILVICIVIECFTFSLTTIWAALASVPLIFISRTSLSLQVQILIFAVITLLLIIGTRPLALKLLRKEKNENINNLEGQKVIVTKKITATEKGEAKASNGVIWTAKSNNSSEIEKDSVCRILKIEGNTLIVELI